jgi:hypothetical protein
MSNGLSRITELAKEDPDRKFFSIAHILTPEAMHEAFLMLRRDASPGVDHVTYRDYEKQAEQNIQELHERLKNKTYRALPLRRVREQLMEMIERRTSDPSVLIRKWINIGDDDGRLLVSETGTGQGQIISPLLANVYLHFVLDEWIERDVKPRLRSKVFVVRYADDAVFCFQHQEDTEKVLEVLPKRFARYGLTLHPEKTRLVPFGREALDRARRAGTKADTFDFLGFSVLQRRKDRRGRRRCKAAWKMRAGPSDLDQIFLADSYGYRQKKSALDAVDVTRKRCWKYDWILEFDIKGLLDDDSYYTSCVEV